MSFNLPNSIATGSSDPYWASLVPSSTTANPDTATKKHYAAVGSGGPTDVVFELNNGIITVDVNASFTGTDWPTHISKTGFQNNASGSITVTTSDTIYLFNLNSTNFGSFVWQSSWITSTGPTVTSHYWVHLTNNAVVATTDTVQGSDFTFLKNSATYAPSNLNLTAISSGYVYDYTQNDTAMYTATIDSKPVYNLYVDESWTQSVSGLASGRNTTSNRILNVLGTIPSDAIISSTSLTLVKDTDASSNRYIRWYSATGGVNSDERNHNYGMYITTTTSDIKVVLYYYPEGFGSNITYSSEFSIGDQATLSYTAGGHTMTVQDWIYSDEPEGDGYVAPVTTTSNGEGKPDRYPLIMTNLFNRNRSLYSIGMTHKDDNLFL